MVERHPFMLEEQNAAFKVLPRTRDHIPHSRFSVNKVWTSLAYTETELLPFLLFQMSSVLRGDLQAQKLHL